MGASLEFIEQLKRKGLVHVARQNPDAPELVPTSVRGLDSICSGGLARGRISEIITGPWEASSVIFGVLAQAAKQDAASALVDPGRGFDGESALAQGVSLDRLLWVVPRDVPEALRAAELILATEGFGVLVLDLSSEHTRTSPAAWMRMDRLARRSRSVVLVLSKNGEVGAFAHVLLRVSSCRPPWRRAGTSANSKAPIWLAGVELDFVLHRRRSA